MRVIVRVPNWLGDAVLALPSVAALAARRDVRLTVLAAPYVHPLYEELAEVRLSPLNPRARNPLQARSLGRALAGDHDVAIALPPSFSSALIFWFAGIPRRVGRATEARGFLLTERLPPRSEPPRPMPPPSASGLPPAESPPRREVAGGDGPPAARGAGAEAKSAGFPAPGGAIPCGARADDSARPFHRWRDYAEVVERVLEEEVVERYPLHVPVSADARAEPLLAQAAGAGPLIGLNAGANWPSRRWPGSRFAAVGRALRDALDARVVVLGGRSELDIAPRVALAIPGARSLAGRTDLKTLMAVLRRLDLLLTNDTGPMHVAAALGTPLIDLCGAADERVTGPRGPRSRVVREFLFCSPCVRNVCPFNLECMDALTVPRVLDECLAALRAGRAA